MLTSCNLFKSNDKYDENEQSATLESINLSKARTTIKAKQSISKQDIVSYRDDNYYYFVCDLGKYYNIPVESTYCYCSYGGFGDVTKTLTASSVTSKTIENSTLSTYQKTLNFSKTFSSSISAGASVSLDLSSLDLPITVNAERGYSMTYTKTTGESTTNIWTNTYEEASTYSESESRTTSISFKSGDPLGKYYYYLSVDTQVYGTIIKSISTGEYFITINSAIIGRGFNYIYSNDDELNFECDDQLEFDYDSIIEKYNLDKIIPENYTGSKIEDGKIHIQNVTGLYKALKDAKADDIIVLDNDIDCTDYPWTPLNNFYATLEGNGYTIKNLTYILEKSESSENLIGMFKELSGTVNTLKIDNLNFHIVKYHVPIENLYVGAICARLTGGKIELCEINNSNIYAYHDTDNEDHKKSVKTKAFVGGYVGELVSGTVINCSIKKTQIYGKTRINYDTKSKDDCWLYVGGIVGHLASGSITDCTRFNDVNVTAHTLSGSKTSAYHCHVGGVAGYKDGGTISNCISTETGLNKKTEVEGNRKANSSSSGLGAQIGN